MRFVFIPFLVISVFASAQSYVFSKKDPVTGLYGFEKSGELVVDYQYEKASSFSEGLAAVKKGGKWGYINVKGETVIPFQFNNAYAFNAGFAPVFSKSDLAKYRGKIGFIDTTGALVVDTIYRGYRLNMGGPYFPEDKAPVSKGGQYGYVNSKGQEVIDFQYDNASYFNEGMAAVGKEGEDGMKFGFIDSRGNLMINYRFDERGNINYKFHSGWSLVYLDGKTTLVNKMGELASAGFFEHVSSYPTDGMRNVRNSDGKKGYINTEGELVGDRYFEDNRLFSEGAGAVQEGEKWGFIDKTGAWLIKPVYDAVNGQFMHGVAWVEINKESKYINRKGEFVEMEERKKGGKYDVD